MNTINSDGTDFNRTMFNENMNNIAGTFNMIGNGIISGLILSLSGPNALTIEISTGSYYSEYPRSLGTAQTLALSAGSNNFVWIAPDGTLSRTSTSSRPSSAHTCLGNAITNGSIVTSLDWSYRDIIPTNSITTRLSQGVSALTIVGGTAVLAPSEFDATMIAFTGTLTSNATRVLPNKPGCMWFVSNKTSGAFSLSLSTAGGTPISITQNFGCLVMSNGSNIIKVAAEIAV